MKSTVELDIQVPRDEVAALFADPANNPKWMHDLARYEPLQGAPGTPGSTYRMVPKTGDMVLVATVLSRNVPDQVILRLDGRNMVVLVTDRFIATSPRATRMMSEEEFRFTTIFSWLFGLFALQSIRKAHRQHMESFKAFAEQQARQRTRNQENANVSNNPTTIDQIQLRNHIHFVNSSPPIGVPDSTGRK